VPTIKPWPHIALRKSPVAWGCLPTSFSMATGIPYEEWVAAIGHDGSQIIFEYLPDPTRRRGFHPQELIRAALGFGISVTELQINPITTTDGRNMFPIIYKDGNVAAFMDMLRGQRAVIAGITNVGIGHACAFDGDLWLRFDSACNEPVPLWDGTFTPSYAYLLHHLTDSEKVV